MNTIPLFPLSRALFPGGVLHLRIFEVRYLDMIRKCIADGTPFGVVALLQGAEVRIPTAKETLASVGTLAQIDEWNAPMPALIQARCLGTTRFRMISTENGKFGLWRGSIELLSEAAPIPIPADLQPAANTLGKLIADMQKGNVPAAAKPIAPPFRLDECGWVADRWSELLPLPPAQAENLLALDDAQVRLRIVHNILQRQGLLR